MWLKIRGDYINIDKICSINIKETHVGISLDNQENIWISCAEVGKEEMRLLLEQIKEIVK